MRVSLFVTCLVDQLYPRVGLSAVRVLESLGVEVDFDQNQTCCGQPALNSGYNEEARQVAGHFLDTFRDDEHIVVPSGSCATMVKVFLPGLFPEGSKERQLADSLSSRTWELSDFLVSVLKAESTGASFQETVTYHDSCHLLRELGISEQPRRLIRSVEGIDFREMSPSDRCCGFGGTFAVKFPELSVSMGQDKIERIRETGADFVVGNDISCLMQISGLLRRANLPVQTLHLAELLAKSPECA